MESVGYAMISKREKAYYGYFHIHKANEELPIDLLLISDCGGTLSCS